jgi:hypothetical protein
VFCDVVGEHANDDDIRDAFYDALDAASLGHLREGDEPIVFHDLTHSMGTMCAAAGIDLRRIQAWMRHADIQTTMRYLHYVPAHDDAARLTAAFTPEDRAPGRAPNRGHSPVTERNSSRQKLVPEPSGRSTLVLIIRRAVVRIHPDPSA